MANDNKLVCTKALLPYTGLPTVQRHCYHTQALLLHIATVHSLWPKPHRLSSSFLPPEPLRSFDHIISHSGGDRLVVPQKSLFHKPGNEDKACRRFVQQQMLCTRRFVNMVQLHAIIIRSNVDYKVTT